MMYRSLCDTIAILMRSRRLSRSVENPLSWLLFTVSLTEATGSPKGLRGSRDADDPMNLIRVMPAEEFVTLPCSVDSLVRDGPVTRR